ncbi:MFS transporter, SP family, general alpha glucoside:H+ symporter [Purpureocillium lavendulum]|uniref:MFS transporter, SP family, general alpha glucoside:H+ symporter n=1 Tax=Purpureocillium lavendulum TaxID=1247861 RepID=A0AB34G3I4_9HYPO|nr:MFS transporter, SP family, general alpha glucoside:H+ symporter [Purpureocillium lavendulum]
MGQSTEGHIPPAGGGADEIDRLADATDANDQEHEMTLLQALRLYPKGVLWSVVMSTGVVMDGYDTKLVGTLYAQPAFQKAFGTHVKGNSYQISAPWQTGLSNGSAAGQLVGLLLAGYLSERFGFRKTMVGGLAIVVAFIFMTFFAPNITVLAVGQTLFGIPLGLFQTVPVVYALETAPMCLRPYLTNYVNSCYVLGQILATGLLRGVLDIDNQWAYRIPFAVQWIWPIILIPLLFFAPESPWWLVRQGRLEEAKAVLRRLTSPQNTNFDINKSVTMMIATTEHERTVHAETSYRACFQSTNLKRTMTVIAWNWGARTGFFWAGGCLIAVIFAYFYVPEPMDRTPAELDVLFERNVPARHFSKTRVDLSEALFEHEVKST